MVRTRYLVTIVLLLGACASEVAGGEDDEVVFDPEDPCQPGPEPSLELGQGASAYATFVEGDSLELVHGPQGGVHTFMALDARDIDASAELVGELRGYLDGEQIGASYPYLNFRCQAPQADDPGGQRVWGVLLIWEAPPESLHLRSVHIEAEITDASGLIVTTCKDAILHDPLQE